MRSLITATNTRSTKELNIINIRTIRLRSLKLISKPDNDFDEKEFKKRVDSADYLISV